MNFNFDIFPKLKTDRLVLKKANSSNLEDIKAIFDLRSSEEINKFVLTKRVENFEEAKNFILVCNESYQQKKRIFWLIQINNKIIGSIVLHRISLENNYAEIGYKLKPNFQQKGLMSEAIKTVIEFGFEKINLKTIEAFTHKNNLASIALLKKHGFIFQLESRDDGFDNNRIYKLTLCS